MILYKQAGVLAFRKRNGQIEILLISTRKNKKWTLPKGTIKIDSTAIETAEREAWEEAGIQGKIYTRKFGYFTKNKWPGLSHVDVFLMHATSASESWPEAHVRTRKWLTIENALQLVDHRAMYLLIMKFKNHLIRKSEEKVYINSGK